MSPFEEFLKELAKALQFPNLKPDNKGACLIILKEGEVPLLFEYDDSLVPNTILVSSEIAPLPHEILTTALEEALIANHFCSETFSLKPDGDFLYLHRRLHPKIPSEQIKEVIESMNAQVKKWRYHIKELLQAPPKKKEESSTFKMHQFRV